MTQKAEASAPARANLLGEHTDYNFGYVMPTPLHYRTKVSMEIQPGQSIVARSSAFKEDYTFKVGANKRGLWTDYISGCINVLKDEGHDIPGLSIFVESEVPMGMGISSSAALSVSTLRALYKILDLEIDDMEIARLAHKVETDYVGVPCGIMDQTVCSTGKPGYALFLDTKTLETELIKLPDDYQFCILHSGVQHQLKDGDGGYKQRVAECKEACRLLNIPTLRDMNADLLEAVKNLPDPLNRRVLHVYSENQRVLLGREALKKKDVHVYGRLMIESHESQRDNYEVSIPRIDEIVKAALANGAVGARLTGGGFGGSVVALVKKDEIDAWWAKLSSQVKGITLL